MLSNAKFGSSDDLPHEEWKRRFDAIINRSIDPDVPLITPEMKCRIYLYDANAE